LRSFRAPFRYSLLVFPLPLAAFKDCFFQSIWANDSPFKGSAPVPGVHRRAAAREVRQR
jgi:hypothetical protein